MAEYTRPATWEDVKLVARLLEAEGARWALIGGYAIAVHGFTRFSEDVDILVDPSPENAKRWIAALSQLPDGATRELVGREDLFEREGPYAIRVNDEFTIDVMPCACGHGWGELEPYAERRTIDDVPIRVLGLEGLLLTKEGMRDKDRADAAVLRRALEAIRAGRP
jgi:Nucleotidyl transferase AbiEii toxin, Type IV TA system